ncbi:zinc-binding dehydrogenase [Rhizobium leguminosarum]|uniref:zinc-binding dehydrogenase n=1 Tax=Rhizobium leguminosarum TaxID=384 RepID=UPI003F9ACF2C
MGQTDPKINIQRLPCISGALRSHVSAVSWCTTNMGLARVLDYTQPLPDHLKDTFDVVFDCHGGLTSREEDFLTKRSGIAVDIDPTFGNLIRSVISSRHSFVRGVLSTSILQKIIDLGTTGQFTIPISRTAPLSEANSLIGDLEAGNRLPGKSVIVMG